MLNKKDFELIYNIQANEKYYFNDLDVITPPDFDQNNFIEIKKLFKKLKGEFYSINQVNDILEEIDRITLDQQFQSISATVEEDIYDKKINLKFIIQSSDPVFVERINIFGNYFMN